MLGTATMHAPFTIAMNHVAASDTPPRRASWADVYHSLFLPSMNIVQYIGA